MSQGVAGEPEASPAGGGFLRAGTKKNRRKRGKHTDFGSQCKCMNNVCFLLVDYISSMPERWSGVTGKLHLLQAREKPRQGAVLYSYYVCVFWKEKKKSADCCTSTSQPSSHTRTKHRSKVPLRPTAMVAGLRKKQTNTHAHYCSRGSPDTANTRRALYSSTQRRSFRATVRVVLSSEHQTRH